MKKTDLINFIEKYNLQGTIEQVIWTVENNGCTINFVSEDKTLLGTLQSEKGMDIANSEFGVYTTSELLKILNIMDDDVDIEIKTIDDRPYNMNIKDKRFKSIYVLAEKSVIPKSGKLKSLPDFNVSYTFDKAFIDDYLKAKNGLMTADAVAFEGHGDELKIIVGFSSSQTNRVSWSVKADINSDLETIPFSADYLKSILSANKDIKSARLQISSQGLMRVQCIHEKSTAEYFLVKLQIN